MEQGMQEGDLRKLVERALAEDAPGGDITTDLVVAADMSCSAILAAKGSGVLAGTAAAEMAFRVTGSQDHTRVRVDWAIEDGQEVGSADVVAHIHGRARTILRAERVAINLLGHLSGVASLTRLFVDAAHPARVLCTRKTTPGLRALERQAVAAGGGRLHRASLSEAVLIKDNHVLLAGGVGAAVRGAKRAGAAGRGEAAPIEVEVEVETIDQLGEALAAGADRILLDNPEPDLVRQAVSAVGDPERLEVSGGVTLETIGALVDAGARVISVGRITHSAPSLDLSLEVG
jgi:nicotinate-nucleotide pyrophosphorylase (carboxylating)